MIPEAAFREYDRLLKVNERRADSFLTDYLSTLSWDDRRAAVDALVALVEDMVAVYGDNAATIAAAFYDDLAEAAGAALDPARLADRPDGEAVGKAIGYATAAVWEVGEDGSYAPVGQDVLSAVVHKALGLVDRQANATIEANAARDHVMYARVPTSAHPCAFCAMLASRGFAYTSEHSATFRSSGGLYHDGCRCRAVPSFDGEGLEGYDEDGYYQDFHAADEAVDRDEAYEEWRAMSDAEREDKGYGSYDDYHTKMVLAEMRKAGYER